MSIFKRLINATVYVGLVAAACFGLTVTFGSIINAEGSPLFRIGLIIVVAGLFAQGYALGGDNNSETKSAD